MFIIVEVSDGEACEGEIFCVEGVWELGGEVGLRPLTIQLKMADHRLHLCPSLQRWP